MTDPNPTVRMPIPEEAPASSTSSPPPMSAPSTPSPAPASPPPPVDSWSRRTRSGDGRLGPVVFGLVVLGLGLWFFAEQTLELDMPDISWGQAWPVVLIAIGAWIVLGAMRDRRS
jgi:hypothetical protein